MSGTPAATLVDRLTHRSELVTIEAESYRPKEAKARAETGKRSRGRRMQKSPSKETTP